MAGPPSGLSWRSKLLAGIGARLVLVTLGVLISTSLEAPPPRLVVAPSAARQEAVRFLRYDEVREIVESFADSGPPASELRDAASWDAWVRSRDREIRGRIDRGVEDSISNLILFGTSYTALPRLATIEDGASAEGEPTVAARARVHALATALERPQTNERLRLTRDFLAERGVEGAAVEAFLSANLRRFILEQRAYQEKLQTAGRNPDPGEVFSVRATLFKQRGLSVDTSLLPNFALEDTLRSLVRKKVLTAGGIRRIAVIGPGLDFVDKRDGYDFYPLQTLQPFAVMEGVARLGLGELDQLEVVTFDLNPTVTSHLRRLAERARSGRRYLLQLPRDTRADWNPAAVAYWRHFGEFLGASVAPIPAPATLGGVRTRAVSIQPRYAARLVPLDLDIVAQTFDPGPEAGFDLIVATNILVYYDRFEQALAMASLSQMMRPGGVFLANSVLPAQHSAALEYLGRRSVSYSTSGAYGDDTVVYRRR